MHVTLLQDTHLGSQALCAGCTVDVDDAQAQAWIDAGVVAAPAPAPADPPAPKKTAAK
jgi:hypothetical protein